MSDSFLKDIGQRVTEELNRDAQVRKRSEFEDAMRRRQQRMKRRREQEEYRKALRIAILMGLLVIASLILIIGEAKADGGRLLRKNLYVWCDGLDRKVCTATAREGIRLLNQIAFDGDFVRVRLRRMTARPDPFAALQPRDRLNAFRELTYGQRQYIKRAVHFEFYPYRPEYNAAGYAFARCALASSGFGVGQIRGEYDDAVIMAHEVGHNLGADHDPVGVASVMSPGGSLAPVWSYASVIAVVRCLRSWRD